MTKLSAFHGFKYDPETGFIFGKTGKAVGTLTAVGYLSVSVRSNGTIVREYAHRLAFYLMGQCVPPIVDHVNGVCTDNRWSNLRASSKALNAQNIKGPRSDNTSGFLGVYQEKRNGRFVAELRINGKKKHIGYFTDPTLAHAAYISAKQKLHEHNTL